MYLECARSIARPPSLWRYRVGWCITVVSTLGDFLPLPCGEYEGWAETYHFIFPSTFSCFPVFPLLQPSSNIVPLSDAYWSYSLIIIIITLDLQSSGTTTFSKNILCSLQFQSTTLNLTCSFLIFKLPYSYLNLSSPQKLIKSTHANYNMFLSIYIIKILKILILNFHTSIFSSANLLFPSFILLQLIWPHLSNSLFPPHNKYSSPTESLRASV